MATGTNGIATEGEVKSKLGYSGSVDTNKCCTKARAIAMGADSSKLTSYKDNQLVKYVDIEKSVSILKIYKASFYYYNNTFVSGDNGECMLNFCIDGITIYDNENVEVTFVTYGNSGGIFNATLNLRDYHDKDNGYYYGSIASTNNVSYSLFSGISLDWSYCYGSSDMHDEVEFTGNFYT